MTATLAAASLLLAGGAGLLATLLVTPVRGIRHALALVALSLLALTLGMGLLGGLPAMATLLDPG